MKLSIGEWRRLKGISQDTLAQRCGVSVMTIRSWEENPDNIRLCRIPVIAEALEVDSSDIIFSLGDTIKGSLHTEKEVL